jgi:hypothetical protein
MNIDLKSGLPVFIEKLQSQFPKLHDQLCGSFATGTCAYYQTYVYICIYVCMSMYMCMYICVYICIFIYEYSYLYIYIYIYMYMYVYVHILISLHKVPIVWFICYRYIRMILPVDTFI